jgi:hypothetical protein
MFSPCVLPGTALCGARVGFRSRITRPEKGHTQIAPDGLLYPSGAKPFRRGNVYEDQNIDAATVARKIRSAESVKLIRGGPFPAGGVSSAAFPGRRAGAPRSSNIPGAAVVARRDFRMRVPFRAY